MEALHKDLMAQEARLKEESERIAFERSQLDLERAVVEKAANDMAQERAHFDQHVALARDAYRAFSEEKEAHQRAKTEWELEGKAPLHSVSEVLPLTWAFFSLESNGEGAAGGCQVRKCLIVHT